MIYQIRNTEKFEIEAISFPKKQPFPTDHFEVKPFGVVGVVGSGKTTFVTTRYAYRAEQLWQDDVDFFIAEDMWGTLEAIKISDKKVHFVLIDDSGPLFDCRNPMGNMTATQMYWEIRHELKRYAKQSGRSVGGLVILAIVIQDYMGLDKRIRDALGFTVFKTYDKAIVREKLISDEHIIKLLKKLKYKSAVACDWKYRRFAVGVDVEERYTLFYCDPDQYPRIPFTNIIGEDIFEKQRNILVKYLVDCVDLETPREIVQGKLYFKIDKMKESDERCRISQDHFSEIIKRAKTIKYEEMEKCEEETILEKENGMEQIYARIIYLKGTKHLTIEEIGKKLGIPKTTVWRYLQEAIHYQENCLKVLENKELDVNAEQIIHS